MLHWKSLQNSCDSRYKILGQDVHCRCLHPSAYEVEKISNSLFTSADEGAIVNLFVMKSSPTVVILSALWRILWAMWDHMFAWCLGILSTYYVQLGWNGVQVPESRRDMHIIFPLAIISRFFVLIVLPFVSKHGQMFVITIHSIIGG